MPTNLNIGWAKRFSSIPAKIRLLRIRRLYNKGKWEAARKYALKEINCPFNNQLSRSIIIRSYWNESKWDRVISLAEKWPELDTNGYKVRAIEKNAFKTATGKYLEDLSSREPEPVSFAQSSWNEADLLSNWYQEDTRVWLRHPWGWTYWDMPENYDIKRTHPSLLELVMETLLRPFLSQVKSIKTEKRPDGKEISLSYSGGTDSSAAALLMPEETLLAYHERSFYSMINHENQHQLFQVWNDIKKRSILTVPSNHELIRTHHQNPIGFSTDYAAGSHLILLADHLDIGHIAFGTPIDNTWLNKGLEYRDFSLSNHWIYWSNRFAHAGLKLELPINHISEAGALRICEQSSLNESINSCLRGKNGQGCGRCWKCFHKNGPLGRPVDPTSREIQTFLMKRPLRSAQHALWAIQVQEFEHFVEHLAPYLKEDLSWWVQIYEPGLKLISEQLREIIKTNTMKYLSMMDQPYLLESVNLFAPD